MKKFALIFVALPVFAFAQTAPLKYATVCSSPCAITTYDTNGNLAQTTEPAGYVVDIIAWDGVTPYDPGPGFELQPDTSGTIQIGQVVAP